MKPKSDNTINKNLKGGKPKVYVCRYADDMVITGSREVILLHVKEIIKDFLAVRGLEMKEAKTRIVKVPDGFYFLGFNISRKKYNPYTNYVTLASLTVMLTKEKRL